MRFGLAGGTLAVVLTAIAPASAAPICIANGTSFEIGKSGCLSVSGKSYLARCEMVLNNTSWVKVQDGCTQGFVPPAPAPPAPPITPEPAQGQPSEPGEN